MGNEALGAKSISSNSIQYIIKDIQIARHFLEPIVLGQFRIYNINGFGYSQT